MPNQLRAKRIADLNDKFRKNLVTGGRAYMTAGVNAKGPEFVGLSWLCASHPGFCPSSFLPELFAPRARRSREAPP
jgi:hypothetical protein